MIARKYYWNVLHVYSVNVVLNELTLRVIAKKQSCDVSRVLRESGIDTSTNFDRESVKLDSLLVPCCARDNATAASLLAPRLEALNILLSSIILMTSTNLGVVSLSRG